MGDLYHGTIKSIAETILRSQIMNPSVGDRHWLGDGIYFYREELLAYNWCFYEYKKQRKINKMKEVHPDKMYDNHSILLANAKIESDRIFNLSLFEHQLIFAECIDEIKKKGMFETYDENNQEGVILNLMFNNIGFDESFDAIIADFYKAKHEYGSGKKRLANITEKQICIKKKECIISIVNINYKDKILSYNEKLSFINDKEKKIKYFKK